jgi:hypothetical protein
MTTTAAIASTVDLGHTFSDAPTNVERFRDELLAQISRYRQDKRVSQATNDEDYVLLYAYGKFPQQQMIYACIKGPDVLTGNSHCEPPIV